MSNAEALLSLTDISKRFGATCALDEVSVNFVAGEVHALVGENGAGKSTLGRVMLGVHKPDSGTLTVDGEVRHLHDPADAAAIGLVGVSQELSLLPAMSVIDNIVLGSEEHTGPFVRRRANRARVRELISHHGLEVSLEARAGSLSVADQQKVEILRSLGRDARLVVFDEPTARLASHEANELRQTVRDLAAAGAAVVYISHFLEEVLAVADVVTIMRDGRIVRTSQTADESHESLVEAMIGRSIKEAFPPKPPDPNRGSNKAPNMGPNNGGAGSSAPLLRVREITRPGEFADVSFDVLAGEIVGLAGLVGAGRSEVAHAIYGGSPAKSGTVEVAGNTLTGTVSNGLANAVSLIPESRRDQGLVFGRSIKENVTMPYLDRFMRWVGIRRKQESTAAAQACEEAGVRAQSINTAVAALSGGNQQKLLFARAMLGEAKVFIADEPTRGVDVGSKRAIYEVLTSLAEAGSAVLLISSELEEIIGLSHRVLVMRRGRVVAEIAGDDATEANILAAAFGGEGERSGGEGEHNGGVR